jgi:hypothetical protein
MRGPRRGSGHSGGGVERRSGKRRPARIARAIHPIKLRAASSPAASPPARPRRSTVSRAVQCPTRRANASAADGGNPADAARALLPPCPSASDAPSCGTPTAPAVVQRRCLKRISTGERSGALRNSPETPRVAFPPAPPSNALHRIGRTERQILQGAQR